MFYVWKNVGYTMVIYLATITGISDEYYEAATIDGANIFQRIWYITVPMLKPTFIILLLFALGSIMKGQFDLFYQLNWKQRDLVQYNGYFGYLRISFTESDI